ncbi:MAG: FAA hydrolase family protein [Candidatus Omnitrophota bacterium]|jgi:2-keto-4-pentenoate hydratase/2-oxohepta-3-ene-1,7-dioic acid hydratase in catechol pathway|nr:MAG: FAA hydrolase family protein [Candidatus Omnitrophota bacterium]
MKLIRFGEKQQEKPGILNAASERIDVSAFVQDYNESFFANDGVAKLAEWLQSNENAAPRIPNDARLGPPIARPSKIICVGLNYSDHAKESGAEVPKEPVLFSKASTALSGPYDPIEIPRNSKKTDWEVELAFVIGKRAKYVAETDALSYVAGYAVMNDVSEREFQAERCGQWVKGKSHDTFAPLGPYLVTPDEAGNMQNLAMHLDVNGQRMQTGNTNTMIYGVRMLVSYISQFMTLLPGDLISTGTPPGVGFGKKPPVYLKVGDVVELAVAGLGSQRQSVIVTE